MSNSPGAASRLRPLTEIVTLDLTSVKGTYSLFNVLDELVAEHRDRSRDRGRDRGTKRTDGRLLRWPSAAGRDVVAQIEHQVEVFDSTAAVLHAVHDALEPARTLTTRRALSAGLSREELGDAPRRANDARGVIEDDHRAGAEHRTFLAHFVLPEGCVQHVRTEPRSRHAAGDERLDRVTVEETTTERGVVDEIAEGVLHHLDFVDARVLHPARKGEEPRSLGATGAEGGEGLAAVQDDPGNVGHRLDVVDDGGLVVETVDCGKERWLDPREAAFP